MNLDALMARLAVWLALPVNAIVCAVALQYYANYSRRSVLILALSAGLGTAVSGMLWARHSIPPWLLSSINFMVVLDFILWVIGICMLLRELSAYEKRDG